MSSPSALWSGKDITLDGGRHHFLHIDDFSRATLLSILEHAVKAQQQVRVPPSLLCSVIVTPRTLNSSETGISEYGHRTIEALLKVC